MDRRRFLKSVGAAAAVGLAAQAATAREEEHPIEKHDYRAAPCGLYCGVCGDFASGICHGCGCDCGKCIGKDHATGCYFAECVKGKGLKNCADCKELPCSKLVQFTCDPIWRTHSPCIENLRRQKKIGREAWIKEQEAIWQDEDERRAWQWLGKECERRMDEFRKADGTKD